MNINASIIDQQVRGLSKRLRAELEDALGKGLDDSMARSVAFVFWCVKLMLDATEAEALDTLTEGGNDFGVDAISVGDVKDGEFAVTLFQGKYHHVDLEGTKNFPQGGVEKAVQAVRALFNPGAPVNLNPRLQVRIEEVRSLILDGNIPRVRFLLCSNGASWKVPESQAILDREKPAFGDKVKFAHVNHDTLVGVLQSSQPVKDTLQFAGKSIVEDHNYTRVFVGKVPVTELARLMDAHGDRLLERNIRRYLGSSDNRVNAAIWMTLLDGQEHPNFYFYNNGITLICDRFDYNALQTENHKVRVEGLQIINGGQTSKTIQDAVSYARSTPEWANSWAEGDALANLDTTYVLVRLYQVSKESESLVQNITYATNSQNPVDLKDLRSNDQIQKQLELSMKDLGFEYRRKRAEGFLRPSDISVGTAAEAVLSVWREHPQQAKFRSGDHFGSLYSSIFTKDLSAAQVVVAVLLFRIAENHRKRPKLDAPSFVPYAACFAAMLMGRYLLSDLGISLSQLDHRHFEAAKKLVEDHGERYFERAIGVLAGALVKLNGSEPVSLQRLSATFRRGDLLQFLPAQA